MKRQYKAGVRVASSDKLVARSWLRFRARNRCVATGSRNSAKPATTAIRTTLIAAEALQPRSPGALGAPPGSGGLTKPAQILSCQCVRAADRIVSEGQASNNLSRTLSARGSGTGSVRAPRGSGAALGAPWQSWLWELGQGCQLLLNAEAGRVPDCLTRGLRLGRARGASRSHPCVPQSLSCCVRWRIHRLHKRGCVRRGLSMRARGRWRTTPRATATSVLSSMALCGRRGR